MPTEKQIRDRLVDEVAAAAGIASAGVDVREPFASYSISSLEAVYMVGVFETWLRMPLEVTLLWDHATIEALARHLATAVKPT